MASEAEERIAHALHTGAHSLDLSDLELSDLPDSLGDVTTLTRLSLSNNRLTALPDSLGNLTALTWLGVSGNALTRLPDSLGNLTRLGTLSLRGNALTELPDSLGDLTALTLLGVSRNALTRLPESLGDLTCLVTLDLDQNDLTDLPESLGNLVSLFELRAEENALTRLPDSLGNLSALDTLALRGNVLSRLPDSVGNLSALAHLDLRDNALASLPESAGNLASLDRLDLRGNGLINLPEWAVASAGGRLPPRAPEHADMVAGRTDTSVPSVSSSWQRIDAWLAVHAPASLALLNPPVTEDALESAQRSIGVEFPPDLVESLRCHDGVGERASLMPVHPPLSAMEIADHWDMCMDILPGLDDSQVEPEGGEPWWHPLWIPWAQSNGDAQVIDLRPGPGYGRIGRTYHDDRGCFSDYSAPNLAAYLHEVAEALHSGEDVWGETPCFLQDGRLFWASPADFSSAGAGEFLPGPWPT